MDIRCTRWQALTPLAPHTHRCASGRVYHWTNAKTGVIDIPYREDVEDVLRASSRLFVLAYERYGITWDVQGQEIPPPPMIPCEPPVVVQQAETRGYETESSTTSTVSIPVVSFPSSGKRGRPKKIKE